MVRIAAASALFAVVDAALRVRSLSNNDPRGAGLPESSKDLACDECFKSAPYLEHSDACPCFVTDIMTTFQNDASRSLTTRHEYGDVTENTGEAQLKPGWMWHCRPVTDSGAWEACGGGQVPQR